MTTPAGSSDRLRELWEDIGPDRWTVVMFAATLAIIVAVALFTAR